MVRPALNPGAGAVQLSRGIARVVGVSSIDEFLQHQMVHAGLSE